MPKSEIRKQIDKALTALTKLAEFESWFKNEKISPGLILLNNSFIFRQKLKTTKSPQYLAIPTTSADALDLADVKVAQGRVINADFKFIPAAVAKYTLSVEPLASAIDQQVKQLGEVVFVLIGEVLNTVKMSEPIGHSLFDVVELDPSHKLLLTINGQTITINSPSDEEALWSELERTHGAKLPTDLAQPFATAVEALRRKHYAILKLPGKTIPSQPLLDTFSHALRESVKQYGLAYKVSKGLPGSAVFNDLLRIAYTFASDAVQVIRLLNSICDLKPIVRWCTLDEWYRLTDAFKALPWSKLENKPSLDGYTKTINSARNRAFHRLLPVESTLKLELQGRSLGTITLSLFPEHAGRRSGEPIDYEDKKLVDLLADFSRVVEKAVSPQFWQRNLEVMEKTVDLLDKTSTTLKLLAQA